MDDLPIRIRQKIILVNGCWIWKAAKNSYGYGRIYWAGKSRKAHRVVYGLIKGDPGLELDHLCRIPACVNPDHLESVTHKENVRRGIAQQKLSEKYAQPRNCPQGHPMTGDNLHIKIKKDGCKNRVCRTCGRDYMRRKRAVAI